MAWKCPNCETLNQGPKCIVCGTPMPPEANKSKKKAAKPPVSPKIIVLIAAVVLIVTAVVLALALSGGENVPVNAETDDTAAPQTEETTGGVESLPAVESDTTGEDTTETEPPATEPPATEPPETEPPATKPVETEPSDTSVQAEITGVSLDHTSLTVKAGESAALNGTIRHRGEVDLTVNWTSSNSSVAMVTGAGTVIGVSAGKAVITMTASNGMTATCAVTVTAVDATYVSLSTASVTLENGGVYTLTATVLPANATDKNVAWTSSDANVVTVVSSGSDSATVTAHSLGSAVITVKTGNGKTASCRVTVEEKVIEPSSVKISASSHEMKAGESYTLTAEALPENAVNRDITWKSSDTSVVTVDAAGKLTAHAAGRATVTAQTANGKKASCTVTVTDTEAQSITLSGSKLTLGIGDSWTISADVLPENATDRSVSWSSSDETVVICTGGRVTAIAAGSATITARTSNGLEASCVITVESDKVSPVSITLDVNTLTLGVNSSYTFTAAILPKAAGDTELEWESSDETVATVDAKGSVITLKAGKTVITVIASNGVGDACTLTVEEEENANPATDFSYGANGTGVSIINYVGTSESVVIPSKIAGLPVTEIAENAFYNKSITSVVIPDSVVTINSFAFGYCSRLSSVTLGSSIKTIGEFAFAGCAASSISLPASLTSLGNGAFAQCMALSSITIDVKNKYFISYDNIIYSYSFEQVVCVPAGRPYAQVSLPSTVTEIMPYAFCGCAVIYNVQLNDGLLTIGASAFSACTSLSSITIPNSVSYIGASAFAYCSSLQSVTIPSSTTEIRSMTFYTCSSLTSVSIGAQVTSIASDAFEKCPSSLTIIAPEDSYARRFAQDKGYGVS